MNRREFLQLTASAAAMGPTIGCANFGRSRWRFLTADEANTLESLCNQIIPEDQDMGAASAGVVDYVDAQLSSRLKRMRATYRKGIAELDERSLELYRHKFSLLTDQQQTEFLTAIDSDPAWQGTSLHRFFRVVVDHSMQGFYGDPRHGGNRNRASWVMLKLPYPPIRGRFSEGPSRANDSKVS